MAFLGIAIWVQNRPEEADVVKPRVEQMAEVLAASGQVRGREESRLAPEVNGTVGEILVEEGQQVSKGQVLARLKMDRFEAQYQQALERVKVAEAQLQVAGRGPLESEFEEARSEVRKAEEKAQAALESARQRLLEAQRGPREEQVQQARAELAQTQAEKAQRRRDLERQKELYQRGAISKQAFEQSATLAEQSNASAERASQRLAELRNGTRPEELAQARQAVISAEADLQAARTTGAARIQQLKDRPRPEDVALAQAQVEEARAALQLAKEQMDQAVLTAPYDGSVGKKLLRVGNPAGPSAPILTFASSPSLEVRVDLDESERSRVHQGQKALVRANGYPEPFEATVEEFAAEIDSVKGTLETRLWPKETPGWLLPGQTVDVNIILSPEAERLLIPITSVMLGPDSADAFLVENSRIKRVTIQVSSPSNSGYLVLDGIDKDDLVVQFPQGFKDGQKVRTKRTEFP